MAYSSGSGMFIGKVTIQQALNDPNGYTIKASTDNHLARLLPGIQHPVANVDIQLPNAIFVAGDNVSNNQLNILDYNALTDCYSDLTPAVNCSDPQKKAAADLNDDGSVNQFDYNLFLREIATQPGQ